MTTAINTSSQSLPANSFLARCTEDLKPSKVTALEWQSTLWKVAAGVTFVAFTALVVVATIGLGSTMYVPVIGIVALVLAMPVAEFVKKMLKYSENAKLEASNYRAIQAHHEQIALLGRTPIFSSIELHNRGINSLLIPGVQGHPERLAALHPMLARAKFLDDAVKRHFEVRDNLTASAKRYSTENFAQNREIIYDLRNSALFSEDMALETKIEAAFVNAVLRKYDFNGTLEDIATLTNISYIERALGNELNETTGVTNFLTFKNQNIAPITHSDVKRMSVAELGQRIALAMI